MKTFKIHSFLLLLLILTINGLAEKKFNSEWLDNPRSYVKELEACFSYHEIGVFAEDLSDHQFLLINGYAQSSLINKSQWNTAQINRVVDEVDLVFTKYPLVKEDWITNYYDLLADRLKELFAVDSTLNSTAINFRLILQTDCKTHIQSQKFIHGIVLKYHVIEQKEQATKQKISAFDLEKAKEKATQDIPKYQPSRPEIIYKQDYTPPKKSKKKSKKRKEPKCPDFSKKRKWYKRF